MIFLSLVAHGTLVCNSTKLLVIYRELVYIEREGCIEFAFHLEGKSAVLYMERIMPHVTHVICLCKLTICLGMNALPLWMDVPTALTDLVREPVGTELRPCLYQSHVIFCGPQMQKRGCRAGQNKRGGGVWSQVDLNVFSSWIFVFPFLGLRLTPD